MRLLLVSILCAALLAVTSAAPVPKDAANQKLDFPTKVGTRWVYQEGQATWEWVIEHADDDETGTILTIERIHDGKAYPMHYRVSKEGVSELTNQAEDIEPPMLMFKLPVTKGMKWSSGPSQWVTMDWEEVEVPAGKFRALRVDYKYVFKPAPQARSYWFVDGIGKVKSVDEHETCVLKSFVPVKP